MESWGWFFAEMDEIKVKEMMKILNNNDYEAVKKLYCENVVKAKSK